MGTRARENAMHGTTTHQVVAKEVIRSEPSKDRVYCRYCGSDHVYRLYREGFLQEKIYPLFGFYPWRCKVCSAMMMLHRRRIRKRSKHSGE
jgi:hypothetical protein